MNFIFLSVILIALGIGLIVAIYKYHTLKNRHIILQELGTQMVCVNDDLLALFEKQSLQHEKEKEIWLERIEYYRSLSR